MIKKIITLTLLALMLSLSQNLAFAESSPWTQNGTYLEKTMGKFEFGLLNFLGGWSEILIRPAIYSEDDKNFFLGVGHGVLNAAIFTLGGAAHLVTAPIPLDIPLPNGGVASDTGF